MTLKQIASLGLLSLFTSVALAQEAELLRIGVDDDPASASAVVQIGSPGNNQGFLMPRISTGISNRSHTMIEQDGMLFYDSNGNNIMLYNGDAWVAQGFLPIGSIVMWQGDNPPTGWVICDGTEGRPNLTDKFVVGYHPNDTDYDNIGDGGGESYVTLNISNLPEHTHGVNDPSHTHAASASHGHNLAITEHTSTAIEKGQVSNGGGPSYKAAVTTTSVSFSGALAISASTIGQSAVGTSGGVGGFDNRPPYYILAFIMRVN